MLACAGQGYIHDIDAQKCYKFMSSFGLVDFRLARTVCSEEPGVAILAEPKSDAENRALSILAGGQEVWIGITDEQVEGQFVYDSTKAPIDGSYSNWNVAAGEPNDSHSVSSSGEDFVVMNQGGEGNGLWNDVTADFYLHYFICQKELVCD